MALADADWDGDELPSSNALSTDAADDGGGGARLRIERLAAEFGEVLRAASVRAGAGIVLLIDGAEMLALDADGECRVAARRTSTHTRGSGSAMVAEAAAERRARSHWRAHRADALERRLPGTAYGRSACV